MFFIKFVCGHIITFAVFKTNEINVFEDVQLSNTIIQLKKTCKIKIIKAYAPTLVNNIDSRLQRKTKLR